MELVTQKCRIIPLELRDLEAGLSGPGTVCVAKGAPIDAYTSEKLSWFYERCAKKPEEYLWYTSWQVVLRERNKSIGTLWFKGRPGGGRIAEIHFEMADGYRNASFVPEALTALMRWCWKKDVDFVRCLAVPGDANEKEIYETAGLVRVGKNSSGIVYEKEKENSKVFYSFVMIGLSVGVLVGKLVFDKMVIGMIAGVVLGFLVGGLIDSYKDKKRRERRRK